MENENNYPPTGGKKYGYGKKPLWQWILIYAVIGGAVYGLIYYFFFNKNGGYQNNSRYPAVNTNQSLSNNYMIQNMKVETLKEGSGEPAKNNDTVTVNYTGTLENGTVFDSSVKPDRTPFEFTIGASNVIQGWHLGVLGMKTGEKRKLTIPPEFAYGQAGRPPAIPQNATLIFEIDLLKIN